ncbi:FAD-binding oxidoreductase [Metabacillus litoralis]|uniref:FAD-binding oxidoreductase n=1 Tax=Metabacillus litoralis TaxID=152268 RepID=A0A5C6VL07_9BACI|nr:FAD-dependent oxidoreductase [Metabacillus litoralis]TXC85669.1 FAD-binding oxidoreductase [Metabacillus litoralis]
MKKVIVIGAGILGASTAYHLAKYGADVMVIDRKDKGQATAAAAGIVCPWVSQRRNKAWYHLVKCGAKYYPELIEKLKEDGETETGYRRVGAISLNRDTEKLEKMAERAIKRREEAPEIGEVKILPPEETQKLFPPIAAGYGSVYVSGGARVDGRALCNALMKGAIKNGATLIKDDAVSLITNNKKILGVKIQEQELTADLVIVTGGAWSKQLLDSLGICFKVTPQKAQIVHLEINDADTGKWPVIMPPNNQYILSFEAGRIVVGATHEDEAGFDHRVTAGGVHAILEKALEIAPGLAESTFVETRVGFRPFTPGFLPIIGALPEYSGLFLANGLGASGLTSGPFLGLQLANLALDMDLEIDLDQYPVAGAIAE